MRRSLFLAAACAFGLATSADGAPIRPDAANKPIGKITKKMTSITGVLAKEETGKPTQERQQRVVSDLDELIAALEKECAACKGGRRKNNPTRPAADSTIAGGTGGIGDLVAPGETEKDWAKLTPRERDRILQSMSEGFPPEYRTVLERYYRRLAEEQSANQAATPPAADADGDDQP